MPLRIAGRLGYRSILASETALLLTPTTERGRSGTLRISDLTRNEEIAQHAQKRGRAKRPVRFAASGLFASPRATLSQERCATTAEHGRCGSPIPLGKSISDLRRQATAPGRAGKHLSKAMCPCLCHLCHGPRGLRNVDWAITRQKPRVLVSAESTVPRRRAT